MIMAMKMKMTMTLAASLEIPCQTLKFGDSGSHICAGLSLACLAYYKCAKPVLDEQAIAGIILDLPIVVYHNWLMLHHSKHAHTSPSTCAMVKLVGLYTVYICILYTHIGGWS